MNNTLQMRVAEFVAQHRMSLNLSSRLLDLVSEVGELSKELLKATEYGQQAFHPGTLGENWEGELGDVAFSLICIANATGVDLEQSLDKALEKYRRRLAYSDDIGSGK